ncbi:hypothetical protein DAPPUDRAFT_97333 [Daphnia pulex]|uniref:Uncharacterized protein n=1 Tax=Daphnia pulex TaxID=6669 RepID=E9FZM7_DAPPU|nr:hypothetical protein DAPPUDRAFT_97333 [Daphnia pulex]|eukprot:EFX87240.1 hypothetical protein DAPPUDRAFT_97333 [Daphnia pulex]
MKTSTILFFVLTYFHLSLSQANNNWDLQFNFETYERQNKDRIKIFYNEELPDKHQGQRRSNRKRLNPHEQQGQDSRPLRQRSADGQRRQLHHLQRRQRFHGKKRPGADEGQRGRGSPELTKFPLATLSLSEKNGFYLHPNDLNRNGDKSYKLLDLKDLKGKWIQVFVEAVFKKKENGGYIRLILKDENGDDLTTELNIPHEMWWEEAHFRPKWGQPVPQKIVRLSAVRLGAIPKRQNLEEDIK